MKIPFIGNGDVDSVDKYHDIKEYTKCDGVMIGRAALGNPWIFKHIKNSENNISFEEPDIYEKFNHCIKHLNLLIEDKVPQVALNLSKKHISFYLKGFAGASEYRKKIMRSESVMEIIYILINYSS